MSDRPVGVRGGTLLFALVLCATWLVVQNAVLLILAPWPGGAALIGVMRVLLRIAWVVVENLWPLLAGTAIACGLGLWLVLGPSGAEREVGHGRTR